MTGPDDTLGTKPDATRVTPSWPPSAIPQVLPGTAFLERSLDRRDGQLQEAYAWWARRVQRARSTQQPHPDLAVRRTRLLERLLPRDSIPVVVRWRALADDPDALDRDPLDGLPLTVWVIGDGHSGTVVVMVLDDDPGPDGWQAINSLATSGVQVCLPVFTRRVHAGDWSARLGKDHRHLLHRLAAPTGLTLAGMEGSAVAEVIRTTRARRPGARIILAGHGDGLRSAVVASALLTSRGEPGPDSLVAGPVAAARGPIDGGPIDRLIHAEATIGGPDSWLHALDVPVIRVPYGDLPDDVRVVLAVAHYLGMSLPQPSTMHSDAPRHPSMASVASETFVAWRGWLLDRVARTPGERDRRWGLARTASEARAATAERLRSDLSRMVGGEDTDGAFRARATARQVATRLLRVTGSFVAFDTVLEVEPGLSAWGYLLIPRVAQGRMPVVVCQHGLGGSPADITGLAGPHRERPESTDVDPYHAFAARLADRGYVVFAPYLTVPEPQDRLVNPLVVDATYLGEQRSGLERRKLHAIIDWLEMLPFVAADRIGYYGLSYGGHAALWVAPLEPRLRAVVASGHLNDWASKITNPHDPRSFLAHSDEDFTLFDGLHRFTHPELVAAAWPRPTLIEAAEDDPITRPDWLARVVGEIEAWARQWQATDLIAIDRFKGIHEVTGVTSFEFLDRWLRPEIPLVRDYEYALRPGRDLPGIGDPAEVNHPYVERTLLPGELLDLVFRTGTDPAPFMGVELRISRAGSEGSLHEVHVAYGMERGGSDLGEATIAGASLSTLWDLWVAAPVAEQHVEPGAFVHLRIRPVGADGSSLQLYGPRPLGSLDCRVLPAIRPVGWRESAAEPTHEFARAMLAGIPGERTWSRSVGVKGVRWWLCPHPADPVSRRAVAWVRDALAPLGDEVTTAGDPGDGAILVSLCLTEDGLPPGRGSHLLSIGSDRIELEARTPRGLQDAASLLARKTAAGRGLPLGRWIRADRVPDRITTGVLPAGRRYTEASGPSPYSNGLLDSIARVGFTGIWTWLNLEEATESSVVFPELADVRSASRLMALADLAERARDCGLDTWIYLTASYKEPIPEFFWAAHPEVRGGEGWLAAPLCTSDPRVLAYHREVVAQVLSRAPSIAGFVVIFDIEGFYFCGSEEEARLACPRCRLRKPEELALEALANLEAAIRGHGGPQRLVTWSYGARLDWPEAVAWALPRKVTFQADISKWTPVTRGGVTLPAGDYALSVVGPSPAYLRMRAASRDAGRAFFAKTEHAVSQEAIFVPYLPVIDQLQARAATIRASEPDGWFANWEHYGFLVGLPADVLNAYAFDPVPDADELLDELASARYGPAATQAARAAWHAFSRGIRAFPYSDSLVRSPGPIQKGPTHPLWLDPGVPAVARWRSWQNDLSWTDPWGPDLARRSLGEVRTCWEEGQTCLESARSVVEGFDRGRLEGDIRIASILVASVGTVMALIDWITLRDRLATNIVGQARQDLLADMARVAHGQRERAASALPLLEADSRLGFAQDGGGVVRGGLFTPALLRRSIGLLDDLLVRELPDVGGPPTVVPWLVKLVALDPLRSDRPS